MKEIGLKEATGTGDYLSVVGLSHNMDSGMMSYPNFDGPQKALHHPDVTMLAALGT
tara:strand:- start:915 stop:1082 length:168 start_codon:yes stop_codon:yes gene_type:complete